MLLVTNYVAESRGARAAPSLVPDIAAIAAFHALVLAAMEFARAHRPATWIRLAPNVNLWRASYTVIFLSGWLYHLALATGVTPTATLWTARRGLGAVGLVLLAVALWRTARAPAAGESPPPRP